MTRFRYLLAGSTLVACCAASAVAQSPYPSNQSYPNAYGLVPQSDADSLAQQLRMLAADPTNLYALINAARLSLKLGDVDGAAALYSRAEKAAPGNPQVKVGMARLLVQSERPGEALRLFQEAQASGVSEAEFGADRALAYDLIGEQARAQREYRAILRRGPDDETTRRYALSLAISGMKEQALGVLEPLNRRSDRGAWRARAFVLAMTGDRSGADRIATTMMPPGMADGLRPFFDRLRRLGAVDRAFAVHFGQVRGSPTRLADARRAPFMPALAPEPDPFPPARAAPVQMASADTGKKGKKDRKSRRERKQQLATQVAATRQAYVAPLPPPPAPTATQLASLGPTRLPPPAEAFGNAPRADRGVTVLPPPASAFRAVPVQSAPLPSAPVQSTPVQVAAATPLARVLQTPPVRAAGPDQLPAGPAPSVAATRLTRIPERIEPATPAASPNAFPTASLAGNGFSLTPATSAQPSVTPPSTGLVAAIPPQPDPAAASPVATAAAIGTPPPPAGESGDTVLAAIIAGIEVPQSELNAPSPVVVPAQVSPATGRRTLLTNVERKAETKAELTAAKAKAAVPEKKLAAKDVELRKDGRGRFLDLKGRPLVDQRGRPMDEKAAIAWIAGDLRKQGIDPAAFEKAAADLKKADPKRGDKKADAKKAEPPAKAEPQRYWVQVAGGANEDTLGKEWARVQGQAAALKGRQGWTTPLRATNRVLTGPFKTSDEAMTLVNTLKKQGVAAFMFTSDPGQKVTRLGAK